MTSPFPYVNLKHQETKKLPSGWETTEKLSSPDFQLYWYEYIYILNPSVKNTYIDRSITKTYCELRIVAFFQVKNLLKVCDDNGKRFKIPVPAPDATSILIHVDDKLLNDDDTTSIDAGSPDALSQSLKQKWGWQERQRIESGSVMVIRFIPCVSTTSEMFEKIMKNQSILNVELTPHGWNVQYVLKRNWPMSLSELSKRKPHYFSKNTACKRKSRFRRSAKSTRGYARL